MAGETAAGMAANQQALREAADNWGRVFAAAVGGSLVGAELAGEVIVDTVQQLISELYPPASDPGEPPHQRTGDLLDSYESWVDENALYIGSGMEYAPYLEFGTSIMEARPHLRPGIEQSMADGHLQRVIVYSIAQAQTAALAGHSAARSIGVLSGSFAGALRTFVNQ